MSCSKFFIAGLVACGLAPMGALAGPIIGAVGITATSSFPDATFGNPTNLINQGGLAVEYTSGVTDFDSYIATDPQHTYISANAEWFTDFRVTSAALTLDLGSVMIIDAVATWVDEYWGVGLISVALSTDGIGYSGVGSFAPTDWPITVTSYGADVFSFAAANARYVQLQLSGCPQPLSVPGGGCGMGEVAFRSSTLNQVPEPGSFALLGLGLASLGLMRRRKA